MASAGLLIGYIELIFWGFFALFVLKDPYSIDYLPSDVKKLLKEKSDYFHILAIAMVLSGLLWIFGAHKVLIWFQALNNSQIEMCNSPYFTFWTEKSQLHASKSNPIRNHQLSFVHRICYWSDSDCIATCYTFWKSKTWCNVSDYHNNCLYRWIRNDWWYKKRQNIDQTVHKGSAIR